MTKYRDEYDKIILLDSKVSFDKTNKIFCIGMVYEPDCEYSTLITLDDKEGNGKAATREDMAFYRAAPDMVALIKRQHNAIEWLHNQLSEAWDDEDRDIDTDEALDKILEGEIKRRKQNAPNS